jgi:hypothetical protein
MPTSPSRVVGDADDGDLRDARELGEHAFDLRRIRVEAADDEHVLLGIYIMQSRANVCQRAGPG